MEETKASAIVDAPENKQYETFPYTPDERDFVSKWWNEFMLLWQVKNAPQDILGGRTLQKFWDDSVLDYAVLTGEAQDPNDPVQQYVSPVSRDKADVFIGNMTSQLLYPSVKAVTQQSRVDKVLSRVSRGLLEHAFMNDGYPSETGMVKNSRYVHKMVVEGTVHIQDDVSVDGLVSTLVPNEEVFIPNFWEPDLQRQSHLLRAQLNITWENAERVFGRCENFKYVYPQFSDFWFIQRPEFKQIFQGIIRNRRVQVLHVWKALTNEQLEKEKKAGRLNKNCKRAKYYNVLINDIPMYPIDNLSPYKDGMFPISKGIFCLHAKSEYYWGNSLPNKIQQDKKWLDAWKTLIRYKGKLNLLPPMVSLNGNFVDEEILLPAKITPITDELQLKRIEGVAEPVSQSDVMLLDMAQREIDNGSVSPQMSGQQPTKRMTKGEVLVSDGNAKQLMNAFVLNLSFLAHSRSFAILRRLFQFLPRAKVDTIVITDQKLADGVRGDLEVIFKKLPKLSADDYARHSEKILQNEIKSRKYREPKDQVWLDPDYTEDINLFLYADADTMLEDKDAIALGKLRQNMQLYFSRPDLFNSKEVAREFVRKNDDPDEFLVDSTEVESGALPDYAKATPRLSGGVVPGQQDMMFQNGLNGFNASEM